MNEIPWEVRIDSMGKSSGVESQVLGQQEAERLAELGKEGGEGSAREVGGKVGGDALEAKPGCCKAEGWSSCHVTVRQIRFHQSVSHRQRPR